MRISAVLLLVLATAAIGFYTGRVSAPEFGSPLTGPAQGPGFELTVPDASALRPDALDEKAPGHPQADLLRALELPPPPADRGRAIRLAMNAWLAADGARAIAAAQDDPRLRKLVHPMLLLAVFVYPHLLLDDASPLRGIRELEPLIATAATSIANFDPDTARALMETYLPVAQARALLYPVARMSSSVWIDRRNVAPLSIENAYTELDAILSERNSAERRFRLRELVARVAAGDPAAAAELIDGLPGSAVAGTIEPLIEAWSQSDPVAAARWLEGRATPVAVSALRQLAWQWGGSDFEAADGFANTLTGSRRDAFLAGLADATRRMPGDEVLAWISRYEHEPSYHAMVESAAQHLAMEDIGAAVALIETLPEEVSLVSYISVLTVAAMQNPDAAVSAIDTLGNEQLRDTLIPMVAGTWAHNDAESAMGWATGLARGRARDSAIASVAPSLMEYDARQATDAIAEIDNLEIRTGAVDQMLLFAETDEEAVRLGRDHGFDRNTVLEMRTGRSGMGWPVPDFVSPSIHGGAVVHMGDALPRNNREPETD